MQRPDYKIVITNVLLVREKLRFRENHRARCVRVDLPGRKKGLILSGMIAIIMASICSTVDGFVIFSDDFSTWPDYNITMDDWDPPGGWTLADGALSGYFDTHDEITHHCGVGWHTLLPIPEVRDGKWHSYELKIKLNDPGVPNGEYQFWLDGEERKHSTGLDLGAAETFGFSKAALGVGNTGARDCNPQGRFHEAWRAIEFDDYVLSTTYVGPAEPGGDSELPSPPSHLRMENDK
jgi:hypothetical protein